MATEATGARIVILRHGQPALDLDALRAKRYAPASIKAIVGAYASTALNPNTAPPDATSQAIKNCRVMLSSDLPRAQASAQLLGLDVEHSCHATFRESALPFTDWRWPRLSFTTWAILFRLAWLLGFSRNGESISDATARARTGAALLHETAQAHGSVCLVGHGIMNRLLAKQLRGLGWQQMDKTQEQYWGYSVYTYAS